ncbi:MAG: plasmid mobilization protein [Oscillospiraceae bacterium]
MRSENEKKSIVKSIKLSPLQLQHIEEQADKKGMKFSEYMLDCALHGSQGITPQIAVRMQEMVNMALEFADTLYENDYIRKEEFRQRASTFSEICTPLTSQEKYGNIIKQTGLFIEGGLDVWESLR